MAKTCGAKTRAGTPCRKGTMPNGRCRLHGGATPITNPTANPGNLYSQYLTLEEQKAYNALKLGDVNHELRLMRIRLARALAAETDQPELDSRVEREGGGVTVAKEDRTYKQRDYVGLIDKITARIESLERTRAALRAENGDDDDDPTSDDLTRGTPDEPGPP